MKQLSLLNLGNIHSQKKSSLLMSEYPKKLHSFDIVGSSPYNTKIKRQNLKHLIKNCPPTTYRTINKDTIKSPPQSCKVAKQISKTNALQQEELKYIDSSRKAIPKTYTHQLKSILTKEQNFSHDQQEKIKVQITSHNIPSQSNYHLKTNPDVKIVFPENMNAKVSIKKNSLIICEKKFSVQKGKQQLSEQLKNINIQNAKLSTKILSTQEKINQMTLQQSSFPMSSLVGLQRYGDQLSDFEKSEMVDYENIYYIAPKMISLELQNRNSNQQNHRFDTSSGEYIFVKQDQIVYRYEMVEKLGHGSFGQVFKVIDHKYSTQVALKIIKNQEKFYNQALIEIDILKIINRADSSSCLIKMLNYFNFRNHIVNIQIDLEKCMVFEMLSCNLYEFLAINNFVGFELNLIRRFAIQMLQALIFLKEHNIIHCDLKPENILLVDYNKCGIKIIDFGSSCFTNKKMYSYIQSRFYRAPEIILGLGYTTQIDMWSFGCIIAELFTGQSLFQSKSEKELLYLQIKAIGKPSKEIIEISSRKSKFFDNYYQLNYKINERDLLLKIKTLSQHLENANELFSDFIRKCLTWDPLRRMTPEEALTHPWIIEGLSTGLKREHLSQMDLLMNSIYSDEHIKQKDEKVQTEKLM